LASFDRTLFNFFLNIYTAFGHSPAENLLIKKRSNFYYDYFSIYDSLFVQSLTPPKGNFLKLFPYREYLVTNAIDNVHLGSF